MRTDISIGVVPYRFKKDQIQYLLLKSRTGDWEFPKGGPEEKEEYHETALRELEEETSINDVEIHPDFKQQYSYIFERKSYLVHKTVHLFISRVYDSDVRLSEEHLDYQWRSRDEAISTLSHKSTKDILKQADDYIVDLRIKGN